MSERLVKILLVEDSDIPRKFASAILEKMNCQITAVINGTDALEAAKKEKFDLVFMDLGLPDGDGAEFAKLIKETTVLNKNTPIVALTAHNTEEDKERCQKAGMDDFIVKPLTNDKATQILQNLVL